MENFSFQDTYKEAEKAYNLGRGEYFKTQEGENKVRLVSKCLPHPSVYQGKPTFKWLCQVIDRVDGKVKPFFMPVTIYKSIEALQLSEEWKFDGVPMPYDLGISARNAGTKEVIYVTIPNMRKDLIAEELKVIEEAPTVQELQKKIRDNETEEVKKPEPAPTEEVKVDDVQF